MQYIYIYITETDYVSTVNTVLACKRTLFQKVGVNHIAEAVTFARNHQLV